MTVVDTEKSDLVHCDFCDKSIARFRYVKYDDLLYIDSCKVDEMENFDIPSTIDARNEYRRNKRRS